jgi:hypothetical protein
MKNLLSFEEFINESILNESFKDLRSFLQEHTLEAAAKRKQLSPRSLKVNKKFVDTASNELGEEASKIYYLDYLGNVKDMPEVLDIYNSISDEVNKDISYFNGARPFDGKNKKLNVLLYSSGGIHGMLLTDKSLDELGY